MDVIIRLCPNQSQNLLTKGPMLVMTSLMITTIATVQFYVFTDGGLWEISHAFSHLKWLLDTENREVLRCQLCWHLWFPETLKRKCCHFDEMTAFYFSESGHEQKMHFQTHFLDWKVFVNVWFKINCWYHPALVQEMATRCRILPGATFSGMV